MLNELPALDDLDFVKEISKDDWMAGPSPEWYFKRGYSALCAIIYECYRARLRPKRILDFGCGHGCVARMLDAHFTSATVVGQDINPDWMEWCKTVLGIETVVSEDRISDVKLPRDEYDLIWAGSVFSHISEAATIHLLEEMKAALTDDGLIVFSTAGQIMRNGYKPGMIKFLFDEDIAAMARDFDAGEYAFVKYNAGDYKDWGHSLFSASWLFAQAGKMGLNVLGFSEGGIRSSSGYLRCEKRGYKGKVAFVKVLWLFIGWCRRCF